MNHSQQQDERGTTIFGSRQTARSGQTDTPSIMHVPHIPFLPDQRISLPLSWIVSGLFIIISMAIGYGGYRAGFQNQAQSIQDQNTRIQSLDKSMQDLRTEVVRLEQALTDLKETINGGQHNHQ